MTLRLLADGPAPAALGAVTRLASWIGQASMGGGMLLAVAGTLLAVIMVVVLGLAAFLVVSAWHAGRPAERGGDRRAARAKPTSAGAQRTATRIPAT
jgi:hypothetical protein